MSEVATGEERRECRTRLLKMYLKWFVNFRKLLELLRFWLKLNICITLYLKLETNLPKCSRCVSYEERSVAVTTYRAGK
jgi:hypothetical protein